MTNIHTHVCGVIKMQDVEANWRHQRWSWNVELICILITPKAQTLTEWWGKCQIHVKYLNQLKERKKLSRRGKKTVSRTELLPLPTTYTIIVVGRLDVLSGLQRRRLPAAGSRSSSDHQPRFTGVRTQLQAKDLSQHLPEHRQTLLAPPQPHRQHGGIQA